MPRKVRIALAVVFLAALFGWKYWRAQHTSPPAATQTAATKATHPADAPPEELRKLGSLQFKPCALPGIFGRDAVSAQCTTLQVPEDRANPAGRKISLNIAWVPASDQADLQPDPLFFIAGGPGQSAVKTYPSLGPVFSGIRNQRHVILVDQRGTGESNALKCDLGDERDTTPTHEESTALAKRCADSLATKADLRFYTTTDAVADLEDVRKAIGAPKINLYGVSYGTRVAQQYAMRHPDTTRSIVLDSPVPNTLYLANIWARNLDDALALQFGLCQKNPDCANKLGDPRKELDTLLATLRSAPPMVNYRDPTTGEPKREALTADEVAGMVRMFAYMPLMASLLPQQIHAANQGDFSALKAMATLLQGKMKDDMMMGMQMSVVCSEDGDEMGKPAADESGTVLGNSVSAGMAAACKAWPRGNVPKDFHEPLKTPVPTLILSGEFDPVTPPRYGEEIAKTLPNGRLLTLKGQGHNVIGAGCMPRLFTQFLDKADAKSLNAGCLGTLSYAQPFISYNGWSP